MFNQLFPVANLPALFVFGPGSAGPSFKYEGTVPSVDEFIQRYNELPPYQQIFIPRPQFYQQNFAQQQPAANNTTSNNSTTNNNNTTSNNNNNNNEEQEKKKDDKDNCKKMFDEIIELKNEIDKLNNNYVSLTPDEIEQINDLKFNLDIKNMEGSLKEQIKYSLGVFSECIINVKKNLISNYNIKYESEEELNEMISNTFKNTRNGIVHGNMKSEILFSDMDVVAYAIVERLVQCLVFYKANVDKEKIKEIVDDKF